jgi:hypothetical protein
MSFKEVLKALLKNFWLTIIVLPSCQITMSHHILLVSFKVCIRLGHTSEVSAVTVLLLLIGIMVSLHPKAYVSLFIKLKLGDILGSHW